MEKKKYFDELNVFRALIIVWVVIGHSYDEASGITDFLPNFMRVYAYSFHMSAFFLLSGLLFCTKIKRIKTFSDAANTAWDRFKRLMVPYFVYTVITYILKFFFQDYANNQLSPHILTDVLLGINNPNGGLWFLHTLFVLSILAIFVCKVPLGISFIISAALKICSLLFVIDIPVISNICEYSVYFFAGLLLYKYYGAISSRFSKFIKGITGKISVSAVSIVMIVCSFLFVYLTRDMQNDYFSVPITVFCIATWYIASFAVCAFNLPKKAAMLTGNYGMDIYMLGYFVQIPIRVVLGSMFSAPYYLYTFLMFVFGLLAPIPISKYIIRRVPLFKALFLGDFPKKRMKNKNKKTV